MRISSLNATRHGLLSKTVLIEGESPAHFAALLADLHAEFQPLPGTETSLLERMAVCHWRLLRLWGMESASVTHEIRNHKEMAQQPMSSLTHAVLATRNLTDHSHLLDFLARQETRCEHRTRRTNEIRANEPAKTRE